MEADEPIYEWVKEGKAKKIHSNGDQSCPSSKGGGERGEKSQWMHLMRAKEKDEKRAKRKRKKEVQCLLAVKQMLGNSWIKCKSEGKKQKRGLQKEKELEREREREREKEKGCNGNGVHSSNLLQSAVKRSWKATGETNKETARWEITRTRSTRRKRKSVRAKESQVTCCSRRGENTTSSANGAVALMALSSLQLTTCNLQLGAIVCLINTGVLIDLYLQRVNE